MDLHISAEQRRICLGARDLAQAEFKLDVRRWMDSSLPVGWLLVWRSSARLIEVAGFETVFRPR